MRFEIEHRDVYVHMCVGKNQGLSARICLSSTTIVFMIKTDEGTDVLATRLQQEKLFEALSSSRSQMREIELLCYFTCETGRLKAVVRPDLQPVEQNAGCLSSH